MPVEGFRGAGGAGAVPVGGAGEALCDSYRHPLSGRELNESAGGARSAANAGDGQDETSEIDELELF